MDITSTTKCKILADELIPVELLFQEWKTFAALTLVMPTTYNPESIQTITTNLPNGKTPLYIQFTEHGKHLRLKTSKKITFDTDLIELLEQNDMKVKVHL